MTGLRVDHITVAGRNLPALQKKFAEIGLPTEYGGKHNNGLTEMALASFADGSYLELIAPVGDDAAAHSWGQYMAKDAGPCAWAVATQNLEHEEARLRELGIPIDVMPGGRQRSDRVELRWRTARVGDGPEGTFLPFLIQDVSPRSLRVFPKGHATRPEIAGVALVAIAVRDLERSIGDFREAFALPAPERQQNLAWFPGTLVVLASGPAWKARIEKIGEAPCAFVFEERTQTASSERWFGRAIRWADSDRQIGFTGGGG